VPFQHWLRSSLEGIDSEQLSRLLGLRDKLQKPVFMDVVLPGWLNRRFAKNESAVRTLVSRPVPRKTVEGLIDRMQAQVRGLRREQEETAWSDYEDECHYAPESHRFKEAFVRRQLEAARPAMLWDLGCNRGFFSLVAAEYADYVVALDNDEATIGALYERVAGKRDNVLPLVVDLLNPSPDQGWAQNERRGLAARGKADWALCLALVHHLSISGNLPLSMIAAWLASIASNAIVEFVPKGDRMAQRLLATRRDVYADYTQEAFEAALAPHFEVSERAEIPSSGRLLYALKGR
jgi:hypothetical protein